MEKTTNAFLKNDFIFISRNIGRCSKIAPSHSSVEQVRCKSIVKERVAKERLDQAIGVILCDCHFLLLLDIGLKLKSAFLSLGSLLLSMMIKTAQLELSLNVADFCLEIVGRLSVFPRLMD